MNCGCATRAILLAVATLLGAPVRAEPANQPVGSHVILSVSPRVVRWATVHKVPNPADHDPYFHVEVIEKERKAPPWQFKRLAAHIVVAADALQRSRLDTKAKTYFYKDIEFRIAYKAWHAQPRAQQEAGICRTNILECVTPAGNRRP